MLRFAADRRTLLFLCVYAALVITGWVLNPAGPLLAAWVVVTAVASWICAIIAHNTVHTPVFKNRGLNKLFQVWVSLSYGFPVSEYVPGHNLSHHKFTQEPEDVMRTTKVNFRWNLLNFLFFFFAVGPAVTKGNYEYKKVMKQKLPAWNRQLFNEILLVWGVKIALTALDWRKAIAFVWVPHLFAVWGITTVNFLQHDGCDKDHPVNHSRNFMGKTFNWFTLNNGFHGIHHETPGLHWSLTPQAHAEKYAPTIHAALEQPSLFGYMFAAYVYPGKRITYDGKPMLVNQKPDNDWVAASRETAAAELGAVGSGS
jgi:fatty acid desaturase